MSKKKKRVFKHTETEIQNVTIVNMGSEDGKKAVEDLRKKFEKRGVQVKIIDDDGKEQEFYALDFKTLTDHAGDPVLHFKLKEKLVLYLTTQHPDSQKCLKSVMAAVKLYAPPDTQIRDYMVDIKDMLRVVQQKEGQNNKEGIHPKMKRYLKNDLDKKLR